MNKLSMFACGIVLAIGCGSKDPVDKAIAGLEDWKAKMCACKDKACADKVHEDYKKWENDVMEKSLKDVDKKSVSKDKMEKFDKLDDARKDCRRKFNEPEAPPATPPTP
ncbi:MAG TPA: hypothetical protein VMZ53_04545 [Kofleriaceae bacterium]|nr:hypothetical protein [Kofleriaceae bacterium]